MEIPIEFAIDKDRNTAALHLHLTVMLKSLPSATQPPAKSEQTLLTVAQAGKLAGVSRNSVYCMINA